MITFVYIYLFIVYIIIYLHTWAIRKSDEAGNCYFEPVHWNKATEQSEPINLNKLGFPNLLTNLLQPEKHYVFF